MNCGTRAVASQAGRSTGPPSRQGVCALADVVSGRFQPPAPPRTHSPCSFRRSPLTGRGTFTTIQAEAAPLRLSRYPEKAMSVRSGATFVSATADLVLVEESEPGIAIVTLNRPEKRNA